MVTAVGVQDAWVGLGEESTYGTPVTPTRFIYMNSESIKASEGKAFSGSINKVGRNAARQVQGNVDVSGDFGFNPSHSYHAWTMLLKHALGTVSTVQPDTTTAPTVYRHTFTPADALPTGLTIEVAKDVLSHLFEGCKVTSLRISGSAGALLDCSVGIIGKDVDEIADSGEVLTEGNLIMCTNTTLDWGVSSNINVTNFDLSIENPLQTRHFTNSRFTVEPLRNGKRRVAGSFTVELESGGGFWSDFRLATRRQLVVVCTGSTITGSYPFETRFTLPVTELQEGQANANNEGVLTIPCSFESFYDTTNAAEITVRVQNENSTAV